MATQTIRLATASPGTQATRKETLAQLHQLARSAAAEKADILLLPEAYLGGYPRGTYFGCKIGSRSAEGREEYLRYFKAAVDLGDTVGGGAGAGDAWIKRQLPADQVNAGAETGGKVAGQRGDGTREELERIARETGVFIVTGMIEKAGGSLYCSAVYVCPKLGIIGKRRKTQPTATERLVWAQGSPATLKAVSTIIKGVRLNIGAAICWENYMPLLRQALYAQNINLYLCPTADGRDAWLSTMRTIGLEGRCFVVSSNMCVRKTAEPTAASSSSTTTAVDNAAVVEEEQPTVVQDLNGIPESHPRGGGRRNSCYTEEGFEIALPDGGGGAAAASHSSRTEQRRGSVIDEDGHEIVLCDPAAKKASGVNGTASATTKTLPNGSGSSPSSSSEDDFISRGGSCIVSPFGDVLAGPQWEDEKGIIYADVDFDDCVRGRLDLDLGGSYSRNDSFKLSVEGLELDPLPYY